VPLNQNELLVAASSPVLGAPAQTCIARVGEQMVTLVRRLFGVRAYDNRSYEINSCHIAKVLRRVSTRTAAVSLNQRPAKRDGEDESGAPTSQVLSPITVDRSDSPRSRPVSDARRLCAGRAE
jgi:hypothetical protein